MSHIIVRWFVAELVRWSFWFFPSTVQSGDEWKVINKRFHKLMWYWVNSPTLMFTYLKDTSFSVELIVTSVSGSGVVIVAVGTVVVSGAVVVDVLCLDLPRRGNFPPQGDGNRRGIPMLACGVRPLLSSWNIIKETRLPKVLNP